MRITVTCRACQKKNIIPSMAQTRPDLENEKGQQFNVNCTHCGKFDNYHVNKCTAEPNPKIIFGGVLIGVIVTLVLFLFLGAIAVFSFAIPLLVWQQQNTQAKAFNRYRI